ncbi:unnamed protein product [Brassica napus]|nr:unnamed protein product [Brassica napus]
MGRKLISVCYRTRLAKIRAKNVRSVLTCGGEFNSRHIVRRSVPKKKLLMTQSPQRDPSLEKRPQRRTGPKFPGKGRQRVRAPSCPDPVAPRGAVYESGCLGMQPQSGGKFRQG